MVDAITVAAAGLGAFFVISAVWLVVKKSRRTARGQDLDLVLIDPAQQKNIDLDGKVTCLQAVGNMLVQNKAKMRNKCPEQFLEKPPPGRLLRSTMRCSVLTQIFPVESKSSRPQVSVSDAFHLQFQIVFSPCASWLTATFKDFGFLFEPTLMNNISRRVFTGRTAGLCCGKLTHRANSSKNHHWARVGSCAALCDLR